MKILEEINGYFYIRKLLNFNRNGAFVKQYFHCFGSIILIFHKTQRKKDLILFEQRISFSIRSMQKHQTMRMSSCWGRRQIFLESGCLHPLPGQYTQAQIKDILKQMNSQHGILSKMVRVLRVPLPLQSKVTPFSNSLISANQETSL